LLFKIIIYSIVQNSANRIFAPQRCYCLGKLLSP